MVRGWARGELLALAAAIAIAFCVVAALQSSLTGRRDREIEEAQLMELFRAASLYAYDQNGALPAALGQLADRLDPSVFRSPRDPLAGRPGPFPPDGLLTQPMDQPMRVSYGYAPSHGLIGKLDDPRLPLIVSPWFAQDVRTGPGFAVQGRGEIIAVTTSGLLLRRSVASFAPGDVFGAPSEPQN
jgi:hypothetical protein